MTKIKQILTILAALCVACGPTLAVAAGPNEGGWAVMTFSGVAKHKPHGVHNEVVYGIRAAYGLTSRWLVATSLGHSDVGPGDQTLIEANVGYVFRRDKRISMILTGGMGHAFVDDIGESDSFTMNIGMGPAIRLNDRLMIRILNRFRYFENRDEDNTDQEITVGLVVKLGQL
jgi:opacity protein-like surface antigen